MDHILQPIIDFYNSTGKVPGKRDIPASKILWKYKSWSNAVEAAGLKPRRVIKFSEIQLIESLQEFHKKTGRSPRAEDCNKTDYMYDTRTYINFFKVKSWGAVLEKAGLNKYFEVSTETKLSDKELLNKVKNLLIVEGDTSISTYDKIRDKLPSSSYLCERFKSWTNVLRQCNLKLNIDKYDNSKLLLMIIDIARELKRTPSSTEIEKFTGISFRIWSKRFGSYNNILKSLELQPSHKTPCEVTESDEELLNIYIEFSKKNNFKNGAPSRILDASTEIYSSDIFNIRFGSINALRRKCNFEEIRRGELKYSEEQILTELSNIYKLLNRIPTVQELKASNLPSISTILRYCKTTSIKEAFTKALNIK